MELFDAVGRHVSELGEGGFGKDGDACPALAGRTALSEPTTRFGTAVDVVDHGERPDRLAGAQQTPLWIALRSDVVADWIAYPRSDRIELSVELGHHHLSGGQGRRDGDQEGGQRNKRRHPDDKLAPQRVAAEGVRPRHHVRAHAAHCHWRRRLVAAGAG